ncbi:MAG: hypothetical protein PVH77_09680 [Phycisphaerales bacterium]
MCTAYPTLQMIIDSVPSKKGRVNASRISAALQRSWTMVKVGANRRQK